MFRPITNLVNRFPLFTNDQGIHNIWRRRQYRKDLQLRNLLIFSPPSPLLSAPSHAGNISACHLDMIPHVLHHHFIVPAVSLKTMSSYEDIFFSSQAHSHLPHSPSCSMLPSWCVINFVNKGRKPSSQIKLPSSDTTTLPLRQSRPPVSLPSSQHIVFWRCRRLQYRRPDMSMSDGFAMDPGMDSQERKQAKFIRDE
jgi:hypothetical protein